MIAFLKDLGKKKLGIAVFFMLPNATEDEKSDAERLLHRNGFKGMPMSCFFKPCIPH